MRIYRNLGVHEYAPESFWKYFREEKLRIGIGKIVSAAILERKPLSNEGHALNGTITMSKGTTGLNIGGNPPGECFENYISFLEEIGCAKPGGLYNLESIMGKFIYILYRRERTSDWTTGYITQLGFLELIKQNSIQSHNSQ